MSNGRLPASFRDPDGFLFRRDGILYRQVNQSAQPDYEQLMQSGLYQALIDKQWLIPHEEVAITPLDAAICYRILQPEQMSFISYPYEWSFSQLKDAALLTLSIQKEALKFDMSLKDASAYNIQFWQGRPLLIDTLSFEVYRDGTPWTAYRQFCQHFLAPLALMAYKDVRLHQLLRVYIDGIPLDLASNLLPTRSKLSPGLLMHVHMHASAQQKYADKVVDKDAPRRQLSRNALTGIIDSLATAVRKLTWQPNGTEWGRYYEETNYSNTAEQHKADLIKQYLAQIQPNIVWDLGANNGRYSRIASDQGIFTVASDIDPAAVEQNYLQSRQNKERHVLPLIIDLTNPSGSLGWHHQERESLVQRANADVALALALIHHLAIGNNVPLPQIATFFRDISPNLIVEFVPKSDSQVQKLLATREDIFPHYTAEKFEEAFAKHFRIQEKQTIVDSDRILYLMVGIA